MLTPEKIQGYKRRLENDLKETRDWLETHPETLSQEELEGYDETYQRTEAIIRRKKEYRQKKEREVDIIAALERIENGTFGVCVSSSKDTPHEIEGERLDADPSYKRCCTCQANHFAAELEALKLKVKNNNRTQNNKNNKKKTKNR